MALFRVLPKYQTLLKNAVQNVGFRASVVEVKCYSSNAMDDAKKRVGLLTEDPGNDVKLKMYALFKQATTGPCNTKKPGVFDFVGQAKWSAWSGLGQISKEEAEKQYISLVDSLVGASGGVEPAAATEGETKTAAVEGIEVTHDNGVCTISLNRPKKFNAITTLMYDVFRDTLNNTAKDNSVKLVYITGAGDYFSSGNDLSNFTNMPPEGPKKLAADGRQRLKEFVEAFIHYPKPIVCGINGPAIGIMVTILTLTDLVYASEKATFHTPFMSLGQSPEGCSSYTFPKIMGYAKANEVLLGGRKLTAHEANDRGLVTDVIPDLEFQQTVGEKLKHLTSLPINSIVYSKALNREREKETLLRVNEEECVRLEERWLSEDCMKAVMAFMAKRSS